MPTIPRKIGLDDGIGMPKIIVVVCGVMRLMQPFSYGQASDSMSAFGAKSIATRTSLCPLSVVRR